MTKKAAADYVSDSGWRRTARLTVKKALAKMPHDVADFVYCQIKGTCKRFGVPKEPQIVSLLGDIEMRLDLSDGMQRNMYYLGFLEPRYLKCLSRYVSPGNVFIDIGANVGYYTIWAAKQVGQSGRVFSFEPNPIAFHHLQDNVAFGNYNNVSLYQVALGESNSAGELMLCVGQTGGSRLITDNANGTEVITVPIKTLDTCLQSDGLLLNLSQKVDVIKVDAEGAETSILKGAHSLLTTHSRPYLMVEVDNGLLKALGSSARQLLDHLHQLDYLPFRIIRDGNLREFDPGNDPSHQNLFFVPREKPVLPGRLK